MKIAFLSWRDLANTQAGGSELLLDHLASGSRERGHETALFCGGPISSEPRAYPVHEIGGTYSQYLRAPIAFLTGSQRWDLVVDVENGIPYFAPLWRRDPVLCLVHHVHGEQWWQRFPAPLARVGWEVERRGMPRAYRRCLFAAGSPSTADALARIGVEPERIRVVFNGVAMPDQMPVLRESPDPLFLALGRLVPHKRIDLLLRAWEVVRPVVGGRLIVAGDGPERDRLGTLAGPGVEFRGRIDEDEKRRLLADAWLLVHPAMHEGWGIVVLEAAVEGTATLAFDVPGVRDAIVDGETGVLARTEAALVDEWLALAGDAERRRHLGANAQRRAKSFSWDSTVDAFLAVAEEAVRRPRSTPGRARPAP